MNKLKYLCYNLAFFLFIFIFVCCASKNKAVELQSDVEEKEENSLTFHSPSNFEEKINLLYSEMISSVRNRNPFFTSPDVSWFNSLTDDGKYFYAIGTSEFCASEKSARSFAERDARQTLKKNALEISAHYVDITMWEVSDAKTYWVKTQDGLYRYIAAVLIHIDRDRVVKPEQE